jgi:glycolate oxidase iron-sulfur subunit
MALKNNNSRLLKLTDKCTDCGNCRTVCPVFLIKKEEIYSTRGRINLIKGLASKELDPNGEIRERINICLGCGQCVTSCPADVNYPEIIKNAKLITKTGGSKYLSILNLEKKLFSSDPKISEFYFRYLGKINNFFIRKKKLIFFKNLLKRLSGIYHKADITYIPGNNFFKMKIRHPLKDYSGTRIALFTGCGGKYLYPGTSDRFVSIMRSVGIEVLIPIDQVCCGNPLSYRGMLKESSSNLKSNVSAFNSMIDIKQIVCLCTNAANTFKTMKDRDIKPEFRMEMTDWTDVINNVSSDIEPLYENSIIFHSCPKCGNADKLKDLVAKLYSGYTEIPPFTKDFCGSTELLDKSNYELRFAVTDSFFDKNRLAQFDYIACSSFECIEYLNDYFSANEKKIRAIHFIDALRSVRS